MASVIWKLRFVFLEQGYSKFCFPCEYRSLYAGVVWVFIAVYCPNNREYIRTDTVDRNEAWISPSTLYVWKPPKYFRPRDDLKSGQTKMKFVLADFLVGAGIKRNFQEQC